MSSEQAYAGVVLYVARKPAPPLDAFVDYLWLLSDAPSHARERIVPSGTLELVINLDEDVIRIYDPVDADRVRHYSGAVVSGTFRRCFVVDTQEHASIVGVHFRPGGAFPFLGVPAGDLTDGHVELAALWSPPDSARLRDRLCGASTAEQRFRLVEEALLAQRCRPLEGRRAVRVALDHLILSGSSVRHVADVVGLSHRRFIEVFRDEVGMTPKVFRRVRRFQRVLLLAGRSAAPGWAQLALDCGYFDQSHLIRDFVAFAGITPAEYLHHRSEDVKENHIPLVEEGSNSSNTERSPGRRFPAGGRNAPQTRKRQES